MCFDCFTRKGCPQLIVHTDCLKWPVVKQYRSKPLSKAYSHAVVCEISIKDRIQSQKVVSTCNDSITSSLKSVIRKGWFVAYQDLNKEENGRVACNS